MLGFFSDPYPDELLYSACARFNCRMKYHNKLTATRELLGSNIATAVIDFPNKLERLINLFPPGHRYTVDSLIDEHTLLPFYASFVSGKRLLTCKQDMRSGTNRVRSRLGLTTEGIDSPRWLRFCPSCVIEDRGSVGETYWHRIHQITCVVVCPKHQVLLRASNTPWQSAATFNSFLAAESSVPNRIPRLINPSNVYHSILLKIARDSAWLLSQRKLPSDYLILRKRYHNLLLRHGYAYYNGRIRTTKLLNDFINYYSPALLEQLQCPIDNTSFNWLSSLMMKSKVSVVNHPLRHLLLITFLGYTAEQFFTLFEEFRPFGKRPWPCLNQAARHYKKLTITKCLTTDSVIKRKRGKPLGTFSCECGFAYNRVGPDTSIDDRYRFNSVQSYGPMWEKTLRRLWGHSCTLQEIATKLGVCYLTVVRHAIRLKLPMNIDGARRVGEKSLARYKRYRQTREEALRAYRSKWVRVLKAYPDAGRKQLISMASFLYLWLRKNDSEWLESHLPPPRKANPPNRSNRINWSNIDSTFSDTVRTAIKQIKSIPDPPVRASLAEIITVFN